MRPKDEEGGALNEQRGPDVSSTGSLFLLGPAYSGKSELALSFIPASLKTAYIGTAIPQDPLLQQRIQALQSARPKAWETVEAKLELTDQIRVLLMDFQAVLVDSFNLWLANALLQAMGKYDGLQMIQHFEMEVRSLCELLRSPNRIVVVSSEAGAGVSPPQEAARLFRQILGHAHVQIAKACPSVAFVQAGLLRWEKRRL